MKQLRRAVYRLVFVSACICLLLPARASAITACTLCIIEVQTVGATGDETQDFVILANNTNASQAPTNLRLQYLNSAGVLDSSVSPGSFAPNETKVFVSASLKPLNPDANSTPLTLPLASSGGSLRLVKLQSSASTAISTMYDEVSWGISVQTEGSSLPAMATGATVVRKQVNSAYIDTNSNIADFSTVPLDCAGAEISEAQPFVTDDSGQTIDAWVELVGTTTVRGNCWLATDSGDRYEVPADLLPTAGSLAVINRAMDTLGHEQPLHLGTPDAQLWLAGRSTYGGDAAVYTPWSTTTYSNMTKGQSWALIDGTWRRTYAPTSGQTNTYLDRLPLTTDDPTACDTVRINELLPNPTGDDTGKEWLEIYNDSDDAVPLGNCEISINGAIYTFLPDDSLAPRQILATTSLYIGGDDKQLSLANSGTNMVALLRLRADGSTDTVQSFIYADAPEGQSYARFDDGWAWTYIPTFGTENVSQIIPTPIALTESSMPAITDTAVPEGSISITELLPNPAPPLTDGTDEFVELYNGGTEPVDLSGYKVQTGNSFSYSYTISSQTIAPGSYLLLTSGTTNLSLSNSGGKARLLAPDGGILSETDAYENAPEGEAWALIDGVWQWTTSSTPGALNTASVGSSGGTSSSSTSKVSKATSAKSTVAPKVKAATTTAPKSAKSAATNSGSGDAGAPQDVAVLHTAVVAGVSGLALLYAGYEYRFDMANRIYQLRRYRTARRAARATAAGR